MNSNTRGTVGLAEMRVLEMVVISPNSPCKTHFCLPLIDGEMRIKTPHVEFYFSSGLHNFPIQTQQLLTHPLRITHIFVGKSIL